LDRKNNKKLIVSIDVDSPIKLLNFYKINDVSFNLSNLESFYKTAWSRALEFFDKQNVKASFFVVGDELENSELIKKIVLQAHKAGHEIENHTYSHPYGLANLAEEKIKKEILLCNQIVEKITGITPLGFRSPGYSVNSKVINIAAGLGLKYDSSGFWSIMNPVLKIFNRMMFKNGLNNADFGCVDKKLKQYPYSPSLKNWLIPEVGSRKFIELPFSRTNVLSLPFYNNFNLWTPSIYSNYISKKIDKPYIMYLFHIIEFMDLSDGVPKELAVHPNIKTPVKNKLQNSERILSNLARQYMPIAARSYVDSLINNT
jgi:peptidoglycan/xylan/chitin deacetylase (PgdA/CDA1 family)